MRVTLIAATTTDGFIARSADHNANWTSKADKEHFRTLTKQIGTMIMGSRTFEIIGRILPGRRTIVLSRSETFPDVETSDETPESLLERLEKEGIKEVAVVGGRSIYDTFIEKGLIYRCFITVEPIYFGTGIPLFSAKAEREFRTRFVAKQTTPLPGGAVLWEYESI